MTTAFNEETEENYGEPNGNKKDEHLVLKFENVKLEIKEGVVKLWIAGEEVYNGVQPPIPPIKP